MLIHSQTSKPTAISEAQESDMADIEEELWEIHI